MKKNNQSIWLLTFFPSISLFTSFATLLCCALPALLVTLGMGASLAGLIGTFPSITFLSNYKEYIFIISGILISFGFLSQLNSKNYLCPADPVKAKLCSNIRKIGWVMLYVSLVFYLLGFFFAFIAANFFF